LLRDCSEIEIDDPWSAVASISEREPEISEIEIAQAAALNGGSAETLRQRRWQHVRHDRGVLDDWSVDHLRNEDSA
jgi:hypothetical protein